MHAYSLDFTCISCNVHTKILMACMGLCYRVTSWVLKGAWSDFSEWSFFIQMMCHHRRNIGLKFQLKQSCHLDTWRAYAYYNITLSIPYCVSLIMFTISSQIFLLISSKQYIFHQLNSPGVTRTMSFLLVPKSQKVWKTSEVIGPGSFNNEYGSCRGATEY